MKKGIVILLVCVLLISLVGCGSNVTEDPQDLQNTELNSTPTGETDIPETEAPNDTSTPDATEDADGTTEPDETEGPADTEQPEPSADEDGTDETRQPDGTQAPATEAPAETETPAADSRFKNPAKSIAVVLLTVQDLHPKEETQVRTKFSDALGQANRLQIEHVFIHATGTAYNKYHVTAGYGAEFSMSVVAQAIVDMYEAASGYDNLAVTINSFSHTEVTVDEDTGDLTNWKVVVYLNSKGEIDHKVFLKAVGDGASYTVITEEEYAANGFITFETAVGVYPGSVGVGWGGSLNVTFKLLDTGETLTTDNDADADQYNANISVVVEKADDLGKGYEVPYKDNGTNTSGDFQRTHWD